MSVTPSSSSGRPPHATTPPRPGDPPALTPWGFPRLKACPKCEYSLVGLPAPHRCPECGLEYDEFSCEWSVEEQTWAALTRRILGFSLVLSSLSTLPFFVAAICIRDAFRHGWLEPFAIWGMAFVMIFAGFLANAWFVERKSCAVALLPSGVYCGPSALESAKISWGVVRQARVRRLWRWHFLTLSFGRGPLPLGIGLGSVLRTRRACEDFARAIELGKQRYCDTPKPTHT